MTTTVESRLEIGEDRAFQRRSWAVQRAGWAVMIVFLIAGSLGLLGGSGPLAGASVGDADYGIVVEHKRFIRKRAPTNLRVHVLPGAVHSTEVEIQVDREYLERFEIQYINPEPVKIVAGNDVMAYTFLLAEPREPTTVTFNLQAERFGVARGGIGLLDLPQVRFDQITYP